ncbi:hypothetical protein C0581_02535 [Candidatus Parcubacteria bacterium]|nr:MAG: hypothetical protein C0581_02535 [Candidatus Parcubacteria bacterium]
MPPKKKMMDTFRVILRKDGIIKVTEQSHSTDKSAQKMVDKVEGLLEKQDRLYKILVDLSYAQDLPSPKARKNLSDLFKTKKIAHVAVFGPSIQIRVMATFIMRAAGIKKFKFFETEKEALDWLKK